MKTPFGLTRLAGWAGRCAVAFFALTLCASALADKEVVMSKQQPTRAVTTTQAALKKPVYIFISNSAIPQPVDRVAGPIATTATPIFIIGNRGR